MMTGVWLPWVPWEDVYLWGLWAAAIAQALFVGFLATTRWRRWAAGRALFIKSSVVSLLLALSLVSWYALIPHLLEVAALLMWAMFVAISYLLWSLVRQKVLDRRR